MLAVTTIASLITLFAPSVLAHGGVLSYSNGGNWYWGWKPYDSPTGQTSIQRPWSTYDPITSASSSNLACNNNGSPSSAQKTANVVAGSSITAYWNQIWPHNTGPVLTYLAQCPGSTCDGVNSNSLKWFKIQEAGLLSGTIGSGKWAAGAMIDNNSTWTTTIPKSVPNGPYLIRFETIALHSMPAQFYPECAQINISGGGGVAPTSSQLVTFPGAYKQSDPGITIDLYGSGATSTTYVIPGPPLYGSSGSGPTSSSSSSGPTTTSSSTTAPPTGTGTPIAHYGQCGGTGWSGSTLCASPYTCTKVNDFYYQCL